MIVKNRRGVDFYTHVVATTPEDNSSRRRIWRYGERSFPSMRTASFRGFFTSGRRSRGRRSDLLKLPNGMDKVALSYAKNRWTAFGVAQQRGGRDRREKESEKAHWNVSSWTLLVGIPSEVISNDIVTQNESDAFI